MLQSRSSEKKLVTPLKNCFFWTQFALKRGHYGPRPIWKKFFWQKWQNQIISFQKVFILSKYHNHMFWLSYESFSILSDVFCQKSHFQWKQLWTENRFHKLSFYFFKISYFQELFISSKYWLSFMKMDIFLFLVIF